MVGGCKGERSGDELGDGSGAPSLQLVATKSEEHDEGATVSRYCSRERKRTRRLGFLPAPFRKPETIICFCLPKLVPDHKYLSRLLKYENNPLIL